MADVEKWEDMLRDRAPAETRAALVSEAVDAMRIVVEVQPDAPQVVLGMLSKRLDEDTSMRSWDRLDSSLATYLGRDASFLLTWLAAADPKDDSRIADVQERATPQVAQLIRTVLALYGQEINDAFLLWQQSPNDWRTFFREVSTDITTNRTSIRVRVIKYNGEELMLEGSPTSFLDLVRQILLTLQLVANPEIFDPVVRDEFEEAIDRLKRLMTSEEEEEETSRASSEPEVTAPA